MCLLDRLFAAAYDPVMSRVEARVLARRRRELLAGLRGHVVDVGAGTGANLRHLDAEVGHVTALEPAAPMAQRLRTAAAARPELDIDVIEAPAEAMPLPDASVDAVVSTLTLCTVDDLHRSISELRRVLRSDGRLLLLEHVAADRPGLARVQRTLEPAWKTLARGCHLTRDTRTALAEHGFVVDAVRPWRFPGGGPASPAIGGVATLR